MYGARTQYGHSTGGGGVGGPGGSGAAAAGPRPLSPSGAVSGDGGAVSRSPYFVVVEGASVAGSALSLDRSSGLWVTQIGCPGAGRPLQCCVAVKESYVFAAGSATPVYARAVDPSSSAKVPWSKVGELSASSRSVFFQAEAPRFSGRPFQVWMGFDTRLGPPSRPTAEPLPKSEVPRPTAHASGSRPAPTESRGPIPAPSPVERSRGIEGEPGRRRQAPSSTFPGPSTGGSPSRGPLPSLEDAVEDARAQIFAAVTALRRKHPRPAKSADGVSLKSNAEALASADAALAGAQSVLDEVLAPVLRRAVAEGRDLRQEGTRIATGIKRIRAGIDDFAGHIQAQFLDPIATRDDDVRRRRRALVHKADAVAKRIDSFLN